MYQSGNQDSIKYAEDRLRYAEKNLHRAKHSRELQLRPRKIVRIVSVIFAIVMLAASIVTGIFVGPDYFFGGILILMFAGTGVGFVEFFYNDIRPTATDILEFEYRVEDAKEELAEAYMEAN